MIDTSKVDAIVWPTQPEGGVAEPPVVVAVFSDVVELRQEGRYINLNHGTVNELFRAVNAALKKHRESGDGL